MAPFRTQLNVRGEEKNSDPRAYEAFWKNASKTISPKDNKCEKINFLHARDLPAVARSRFRNVNVNSLERPIGLVNILPEKDSDVVIEQYELTRTEVLKNNPLFEPVEVIHESLVIQLFDNSIAILELDIDLKNILNTADDLSVESRLDQLQDFGVTLGERLCQQLYKDLVMPFFKELLKIPYASQFINTELFDKEYALSTGIFVNMKKEPVVNVNWVTRTLLFQPEDKRCPKSAIAHWLKDSGDPELIEKAKKESTAFGIRWLNYLFRENAYERVLTKEDKINYEEPFCDQWQAMLFSQYYYAAFEAINDALHETLAHSYINIKDRQSRKSRMKELNRKLERDLISTNLTILEFHKNFGYYKRDVSNYMKKILKNWEFEEAILDLVKERTELCEQKMKHLHQKAAAKSAMYSDLLLLGIAVTSIVAFMFQVIEYGRTISHNADLAVYESNSFNVVKLVSERPTDTVVIFSLGIIIVLFFAYYLFRRIQVLD